MVNVVYHKQFRQNLFEAINSSAFCLFYNLFTFFRRERERGWWACTSGKRIGLASIQTGIVGVDRPSPPRGSGPFLSFFYVFDFVGEGRHCKMLKEK